MTGESIPPFPWREALLAWNPRACDDAARAISHAWPLLPEFVQPAGSRRNRTRPGLPERRPASAFEPIHVTIGDQAPIALQAFQTRTRARDALRSTLALDVRGDDERLNGKMLIGLWPKQSAATQQKPTPAWVALFTALARGGYVATVRVRCEHLPAHPDETPRSGRAVLELYDLWLLDNPLCLGATIGSPAHEPPA